MPTFQDARDGLDALLKDAKGNLSPDDKDKAIINAAKAFSRKFPRILSVATPGDNGFEYALPAGWTEEFSTIGAIRFPWDATVQNPAKLELKDFLIFDGPSGRKLRFTSIRPTTTQEFLTIFTAPQLADTQGLADTIGTLDVAATVIDGAAVLSSAAINVESAKDVQIYLTVSAAAGTLLDVIIEASADGIEFAEIGAMREISGIGVFGESLEKKKVSKFIRLKYTTTGGSFTLKAVVVQQAATGNFTIKDAHLDAFLFLTANIASLALANFYSQLVDSQLDGETTDYEGKATFWQNNAKDWLTKWEDERDSIKPAKGATAFAQAEWDLRGSTGFTYLTHDERFR